MPWLVFRKTLATPRLFTTVSNNQKLKTSPILRSHSSRWLTSGVTTATTTTTPTTIDPTIYGQFINLCSETFLSQPFPNLSYATTTVLLTILIRSTTTLPISLWSRSRIQRLEQKVIPEFKVFRSQIASRAKRSFDSQQEMIIYQKRLQNLFKTELSRLQTIYRCRPIVTILGSLSVHIPVIYILTTVLRNACETITTNSLLSHPLLLERSPILGNSMIEEDLGLVLGAWLAFLVNIELNWALRQATRGGQQKKIEESSSSQLGRALNFWTPERIRTSGFVAGIFMMGYASLQPAVVVLYWFTSNLFSTVQSLIFNYMDRRTQTNIIKPTSDQVLINKDQPIITTRSGKGPTVPKIR